MRYGCRVREGALSYCNAFIKSLSGTPGATTWGSVSAISCVGIVVLRRSGVGVVFVSVCFCAACMHFLICFCDLCFVFD